MPMMRTFVSQPTLSADWSGEYEEKSAEWYELFLDLLLVAAFSNVSDKLKESLTIHGFGVFVIVTTAYVMTWMLFTNFHARYNVSSLLHYAYLYVLLAGLGGMVLANDPGAAFTTGMLLARVAILCMYITIYVYLPRVRPNVAIDVSVSVLSCIVLSFSFISPDTWSIPAYVAAMVVESIGRLVVGALFRSSILRIPMNIDHFNDRMGCLVLVCLGEGVVSAIINLDNSAHLTPRFYLMMLLALLVVFSTAMFYFAIQPVRAFHALRRAALTGIAFSWLHTLLAPALLCIGVGLKFITDAVLADESISSTDTWLLFAALAATLAVMLAIRLAHFGGRQPAPTDPPAVKRLKYIWWILVGVSPVCPLICAAIVVGSRETVDPLVVLVMAAAFNLVCMFLETFIMNHLVAMGQDLPSEMQDDVIHSPSTP
ncbi:Aste57867_19126 [Aphanomyces stellatus]|uniref:Aste57867_19126 protein n=1 Tax=Aphanomyces stellatus TaxID=120398 RepID=A0A485LDI8_9STRA|nr:hypothetical protein As57867_019062 [Aphanomyces stellatus]VFT95849.1 Aste57867_19126 [Aphanomyces stellatus]